MKKTPTLILLTTSIVTFFYFQLNATIDFNDLRLMGIIGLIQLIVSLWSWRKLNKDIISPYIFFLIIIYAFTFGQSILYAFNYVSVQRDILGMYGITIQEIFDAQYVTLIFLAFFHLGALLVVKKGDSNNVVLKAEKNYYIIRRLGWVLFIVSVVPYFFRLLTLVYTSMTYGYGALYEDVSLSFLDRIIMFIGSYFIPSIICLFIGYFKNRKVQYFLFFILFFAIILSLFTGSRSGAVIMMSLLILLRHYAIKKIKKIEIAIIFFASVFILSLLSIIAQTRGDDNRSVDSILKHEATDNAALETLAEMGGSMTTLIWTKNFVPSDEGYKLGTTYLYSLSILIPNLGFWEVRPTKLNMSNWLTDKMSLSYGTGYSIIAEAYINFGNFGWIIMFFMGMFFCKIFDFSSENTTNYTLKLIFSFIVFYTCASIARNSFVTYVRAFFFIALPIYFILKYQAARFNGK